MTRRIFYVIYFRNPNLQATLDAMRFIANPREKFQAHVTVRGPYEQRYSLPRLQELIHGMEVCAEGVDTFFLANQNTVFVRCYSEDFRKVWKKTDFGFNPHITIYDGASREFAETLFDRLSQLTIRFDFLADELTPIESRKGQSATWLLKSFNEKFAEYATGEPIKTNEVGMLSCQKRMSLIETLANRLSKYSSSSTLEI